MADQKHISTTAISMATKFGRVVTYHEELPPILSHDTSNTWSQEVTWQIEYVMSLLVIEQW